MDINLDDLNNQDQLPLQGQQVDQPVVLAAVDIPGVPLAQAQYERDSIIKLLKKMNWENAIHILLLAGLFGWAFYYGVTGVKDSYTKVVYYYTFIVYLAHAFTFQTAFVQSFLVQPPIIRTMSEYCLIGVMHLVCFIILICIAVVFDI